MNEAELQEIDQAGQRVVSAVKSERWDELGASLSEALWKLAEVRPDFEELPSWIAAARESGALGEEPAVAVGQVHSILRSVVARYGNGTDRDLMDKIYLQAEDTGIKTQLGESAIMAVDIAVRAARFRDEVRRLSLSVDNDALQIGRHTQISFHRTLRIPQDGRTYPLPAGFGRLPIVRVEDHAERVPRKWLEQGGFIIPLYQREALFLEFAGVQWRPTVAKVSVGRVNALSGKDHDLNIRSHRQDYVVIPDQRWLDGINSGKGSVKQFVAMPLGKGYTVEAQVTDEEKYGGFQLVVFDPRRGRFPDADPAQVRLAAEILATRSRRAAQEEVLRDLPDLWEAAMRTLQRMPYHDAAVEIGIPENEILKIAAAVRELMGKHGFDGLIPEEHLSGRSCELHAAKPRAYEPRAFDDIVLHASKPTREVTEMGIAAGGNIRQQILSDSYGAGSWDEEAFRNVCVHIVNSEDYWRITGHHAPSTPITAEQYARQNIPWYSDYNELAQSILPVSAFMRMRDIQSIDKRRGASAVEIATQPIEPEAVVRIRTQTLEERWDALIERAKQSAQSGQHRIAAREASQALDLSDKHPFPFFIRALSNHRLGLHADAEADASACLKLQPDHLGALGIRAYSSLGLGEMLLAKEDAEKILAAQPEDQDGLYVRAEANLQLKYFKAALGDAERILKSEPGHRPALRIKAEALTGLTQTPQNTGVTWQQQIVNKYSQIGVKGSPENAAFVSAYKDAQAKGGNVDPHAIADQVMSDMAQKRKEIS